MVDLKLTNVRLCWLIVCVHMCEGSIKNPTKQTNKQTNKPQKHLARSINLNKWGNMAIVIR